MLLHNAAGLYKILPQKKKMCKNLLFFYSAKVTFVCPYNLLARLNENHKVVFHKI